MWGLIAIKVFRCICSLALFAAGWTVLGMSHLLVIGVHIQPRPAMGFGMSFVGAEIALMSYPVVWRLRAEVVFRAGLYVFLFLATLWPATSYLAGRLLSNAFLAPIVLTQHQTAAFVALAFVGAANLLLLYRWGGLGWQRRVGGK
jgi:hypothetical protein